MSREITFSDAAIAMEEKMARFYGKLAENATDPAIKSLLKKLSEEEKAHARLISLMAPKSTTKEQLNKAFAESASFSAATAAALKQVDDPNLAFKTVDDILKFAIQAEKDVYVFYGYLYGSIESGELKDQVSELMEFELKHIGRIAEQLAKIQGRKGV